MSLLSASTATNSLLFQRSKDQDKASKDGDVNTASVRPKIVIIGVGHVFDIRSSVREKIINVRPQMVALELDRARFQGLISKERGRGGGFPILYRLLAALQRSIAEQYGSEVGSEMISAARAAQEVGARIALIDMDATRIFTGLRKSMSFKEKVTLIVGAVMSLFVRKSTIEKEIDLYRSDEDRYLSEIRRAYPSIISVLIDERNRFMADRLMDIAKESEVTVAVVGDGHVSGISHLLSDSAEIEILRLSDLQASSKGNNMEMTYSFVLDKDDY